MKPGIQTFLAEAGEAACYALAIIKLSRRIEGEFGDPVEDLVAGINHGFIHYNWADPDDNDNFFVTNPEEFLGFLTGRAWTVRKESPDYLAKPGELIVQRWERQITGQTISHFRLPDWDSFVNSKTVKFGKVASLRVFAPAA